MSLAAKLAVQQNNNRLTRTFPVKTQVPGEWYVVGGELDMVGNNPEIVPEIASVSLSNNGTITAFGQTGYTPPIGGVGDEGRVRVFMINTTVNQWQQIGNDIVGTVLNERVGISVDLSHDGLTMSVLSSLNVRIFKYNEQTDQWDQYGNTISYTGEQISISDAGDIVAIANSTESRIYKVDNVPTWNQLGSGVLAGYTISLTNDGLTVAVGDVSFNNLQGKAEVYTFGADWTKIGNTLLGITNQPPFMINSRFASNLNISGDGTTLVVGEPRFQTLENATLLLDPPGRINVYRINFALTAWDRIGGERDMLGTNPGADTGLAVSLSDDGNVVGFGIPGYSTVAVPTVLDYKGSFRVFTYNSRRWIEYGTGQHKMIGITTGRRPEASSVSISNDGRTIAISEPTFSFTGSGETLSYEGRARVLTLPLNTIITRYQMCSQQNPRNNPRAPILEVKAQINTAPVCQSFTVSRTKTIHGVNGQSMKCVSACNNTSAPVRAILRNVSASQVAKTNVQSRANKISPPKNTCSRYGQDIGRYRNESDATEQSRSETAASAGIPGVTDSVARNNCRTTLYGNAVGRNIQTRVRHCEALSILPPEPGYTQVQNSKVKLCAIRLPTVKRIGPLSGSELVQMTADNERRMQQIYWKNNIMCRPPPVLIDPNIFTTATDGDISTSLLIDGLFTQAYKTTLLTQLQAEGGTVIEDLEIGTLVTGIDSNLFTSDTNLISLTFKNIKNSACTFIGNVAFAAVTGLNGYDLVLPPSIITMEFGCMLNINLNSVTFLGGTGVPPLYGQPLGVALRVFNSTANLVNGGQDLNNAAQFPSTIDIAFNALGVITRTANVVFT